MSFLTTEKVYATVKDLSPPILFRFINNSFIYKKIRHVARRVLKQEYTPSWNTVSEGTLKGVELYVDPKGIWQNEMLTGTYDHFFSSYLDKIDMKGKTIYDIGAHIGYSTLFFATKVGENGHVVAFEPNPFNVKRIEMILERNKNLAERISISEFAVSNKNGSENFIFSSYVDNGTSSGSFIEEAHTVYPKEDYITLTGFKTMEVKTICLDNPTNDFKFKKDPDIIKIDIEGAEFLALQGMVKLIERAKPLFLIEVHSIYNMYIMGEIFKRVGYTLELLKEETDGRCFFAAKFGGQ